MCYIANSIVYLFAHVAIMCLFIEREKIRSLVNSDKTVLAVGLDHRNNTYSVYAINRSIFIFLSVIADKKTPHRKWQTYMEKLTLISRHCFIPINFIQYTNFNNSLFCISLNPVLIFMCIAICVIFL